ncbi:MAG: hypothetical protein LUD83_01405 [Clostridiales bacterium]|nr:hypothetical protein [Clostridiales bacterium]
MLKFGEKTVKNRKNSGFIKEIPNVSEFHAALPCMDLQQKQKRLAKTEGKYSTGSECVEKICRKISEVCKK